jgi:hypothetical protein
MILYDGRKHKYRRFEDYFDEIENYATRGERFYDEFSVSMTPQRAVEWLRAAFECARQTVKDDDIND